MISFSPTAEEVGVRVDLVLAGRAGITRTLAQRALKEGAITVAGEIVRPSRRLEEGDLVAGTVPQPEVAAPEAEDIPLALRYSDDRVLVISKPPGLVTHPARGHEAGTLVNALLNLGVPLSGGGSVRPGIVHRLDKDTSGLLLVAKDDAAAGFLVDQIRRRAVERRYFALVLGAPGAPSGTVEAPVGRHPVRRRRMAVVPEGRPSVTHYRVVAATDDLALLDVSLETGRTHQIRVHLAHIGLPIVGDKVYGRAGDVARRLGLDRPFLHAWRLRFHHPDGGAPIEVEDPLPPDLRSALEAAALPQPPS
ncbi:MAG TPA: RluA family pseudouridine synthase [Actinomycetota bacterium]|nr:RluA family pseudouridine synthase [Actinomycetota bacterium]